MWYTNESDLLSGLKFIWWDLRGPNSIWPDLRGSEFILPDLRGLVSIRLPSKGLKFSRLDLRGLKFCKLDIRGMKLSLRGAKYNQKKLRGTKIFTGKGSGKGYKKLGQNLKLTPTGYQVFKMTDPSVISIFSEKGLSWCQISYLLHTGDENSLGDKSANIFCGTNAYVRPGMNLRKRRKRLRSERQWFPSFPSFPWFSRFIPGTCVQLIWMKTFGWNTVAFPSLQRFFVRILFSFEPHVFLESLEFQPQNILWIFLLDTSFQLSYFETNLCENREMILSNNLILLLFSRDFEPRYFYKRYSK